MQKHQKYQILKFDRVVYKLAYNKCCKICKLYRRLECEV